eukprot:sb/3476243/
MTSLPSSSFLSGLSLAIAVSDHCVFASRTTAAQRKEFRIIHPEECLACTWLGYEAGKGLFRYQATRQSAGHLTIKTEGHDKASNMFRDRPQHSTGATIVVLLMIEIYLAGDFERGVDVI